MKQLFKCTVVRAAGLTYSHHIAATNLRVATKFALDFVGDDYTSITVECTS